MIKTKALAFFLSALPFCATAAGPERPTHLGVPESKRPRLTFDFRGGGAMEPAYFGSDDYVLVPYVSAGIVFLQLNEDYRFGNDEPDFEPTGLKPRGSLRVVRQRKASDNPELVGLADIDQSIEIGIGLGYYQRHSQVFADLRYGLIGHNSWVGEVGADLVFRPNERTKVNFGPRLFFGDDSYANTYFGISAAESVASGLPAYSAGGGMLSAGLELSTVYKINNKWSLASAVLWHHLSNDAASTPITNMGSADQISFRFGAIRRFSVRF